MGFEPSALSLEFRTASVTQRQTHKIHGEKDKMRTATERAHAVIFPPLLFLFFKSNFKNIKWLNCQKKNNSTMTKVKNLGKNISWWNW